VRLPGDRGQHGAIPEITGGAAILFNAHSPQEFSQAILKVMCEPDVGDN